MPSNHQLQAYPMKSRIRLTLWQATFLAVALSFYICGLRSARAGDNESASVGAVRPGNVDSDSELRRGYLKVYSATDEVNDGDAWYFPHSSYAIYTTDGKFFKNVENHISRSDEIAQIVTLPVGSYKVEARSEQDGYVRIAVVIKEGHQTILRLDLLEYKPLGRLVHN